MYAYLAKLFVALVFVLRGTAPAATHVIVDNNRILSGSDATNVDTGYVAYVYGLSDDSLALCGGSIINGQTILTAAHCFVDHTDVEVYAGRKRYSFEKGLPIEAVHCHPDYDRINNRNDIALVRLAAPLNFNKSIRTIKLADTGEAVQDDSWATVFGFGHTEASQTSTTMVYRNVQITKQEICNESYGNSALCIGFQTDMTSPCEGVSGGPLVQDDKVIGIVWEIRRHCTGHSAVYTRVAALRPWVDQTLAEQYHEKL